MLMGTVFIYFPSVDDLIVRKVEQTLQHEVEELCLEWQEVVQYIYSFKYLILLMNIRITEFPVFVFICLGDG